MLWGVDGVGIQLPCNRYSPPACPRPRARPPPCRRYVWAASSTLPTNAHNTVCKFDSEGGSVAATWHEPGTLVGEPVFVPAPGATAGGHAHA